MNKIADPDVLLLAGLATTLSEDYVAKADNPWEGSPFQWILALPSRSKGAVGEALVAGWCAAKGFDVVRSHNSESDRVVEGFRFEIKLSTLWKSGGYKFQQIRDQNYDFCFCLGISPFDAQAWLIPKAVLKKYVIGHTGQHTGATGSDTAWLVFDAQTPHPWMEEFGGRLSQVAKLIKTSGRGSF